MDEIRRIVRLMKDNDLSLFQFEREGVLIKLRRGSEPVVTTLPGVPLAAAPVPQAPPPPAAAPVVEEEPVLEGEEVPSPMVGTFYSAPAPDAPPFVEVGATVTVGQTLCIIEAMKVMNEIKAEIGGVVLAVLPEDGTPVQFGEPLFRIK